jgi:hypothetical protein
MKIFDQLNLRPQERRIIVVVSILIFIVLNWIFVRPLFGQWSAVQEELAKTRRTLERYQAEIAKSPSYQRLEDELKKSGSQVLSEELQLQRIIDQQATASGVAISRYAPGVRSTGRTNQFFEDQGLTIDFNTYSTNMVEFLVGLASGNSAIRVQEMNLKPDPSGTRLVGNILFVASYQKKTPTRAVGPTGAAKPPASSTTPTPAAPKTNATTVRKTNSPPATLPSSRTNISPIPKPGATNKPAQK